MNTFSFLLAIICLILVINAIMLYRRVRKDRNPKIVKKAMSEKEAVLQRDKEIWRRLDNEQEQAARQVELRNKTLELYEQVRKNAEAEEQKQSGSG